MAGSQQRGCRYLVMTLRSEVSCFWFQTDNLSLPHPFKASNLFGYSRGEKKKLKSKKLEFLLNCFYTEQGNLNIYFSLNLKPHTIKILTYKNIKVRTRVRSNTQKSRAPRLTREICFPGNCLVHYCMCLSHIFTTLFGERRRELKSPALLSIYAGRKGRTVQNCTFTTVKIGL